MLTERCGAYTQARTRPSGSELARLCVPPDHGRGECCKCMIVQARRIAFSLAGKTQDATCELVRPHLVIAVAPESRRTLLPGLRASWDRTIRCQVHACFLTGTGILLESVKPDHPHYVADIMTSASNAVRWIVGASTARQHPQWSPHRKPSFRESRNQCRFRTFSF